LAIGARSEGPWAPAGALPAAFSALPGDANFAKVKQQIPGRPLTPNDVRRSSYRRHPQRSSRRADRRSSWRFRDQLAIRRKYGRRTLQGCGDGRYYYLLSGRWFAAAELDGPWTFATNALPPDFARIPPNSPRAFVLVSVPGTAAAQQALIESQIPQEGTLDRGSAKITSFRR
jgi:hypothetical protein